MFKLPQTVEMTWTANIKRYYTEKDYLFTKIGDVFYVNVEDLPSGSTKEFVALCDYCGEEYTTSNNLRNRFRTVDKDACEKCQPKKVKESNLIKYGKESVSHVEQFKSRLGRKKVSKEQVYKLFAFNNLIPLEDYNLSKEKIPCICFYHADKGIVYKSYDSLKHGKGNGCKHCKSEKLSRSQRGYDINEVREIFASRNCILVSMEYINIDSKLDYICFCGKPYSKTLYEFKNNKSTCDDCEKKLNSKENHWNWQGGVTSENEIIRKSKKYIKWRDSVYERDNYTCQCCLKQGAKLNAHHIDSFSTSEEGRLDINNGITLCEDCHMPGKPNSFHTRYTQFNNTLEQLIEYINQRRRELNIDIP